MLLHLYLKCAIGTLSLAAYWPRQYYLTRLALYKYKQKYLKETVTFVTYFI